MGPRAAVHAHRQGPLTPEPEHLARTEMRGTDGRAFIVATTDVTPKLEKVSGAAVDDGQIRADTRADLALHDEKGYNLSFHPR